MNCMSHQQAVIELHYMPSIPWLTAWKYYEGITIESKESFLKQTYRNRARILTANKIDNLIVPVEKGNSNIPVQEIRIDYKQSWTVNHWRTIQTAYGNAPFFEFYGEGIREILFKERRFLFDLNLDLLEYMLDALDLSQDITFTQKYHKSYGHEFADLRSTIHPKKNREGLEFYSPVAYIQVFGNDFVSDLSGIDLLFNEGPNAKKIIERCISGNKNI